MNSLFPFKIDLNSEQINNGIIKVPSFCKANSNCHTCRDFYKGITESNKVLICPYGFGAKLVTANGRKVCLTCLNVEKYSDKKKVNKRLTSKDFYPRFPEVVLDSQISVIEEQLRSAHLENMSDDQKDNFDKENLDNTIHEIRNLNKQLKPFVESLIRETSSSSMSKEKINTLSTDIFHVSNLLSIRLNTYDLISNPDYQLSCDTSAICIYKKVEKIYKCLKNPLKGRHVELKGNSELKFEVGELIEIVLFILFENAIKYSPKSIAKPITALFSEDRENGTLSLSITNYGICPKDEEFDYLVERGYRGNLVKQEKSINGQGLGLYLVNEICSAKDIKINFSVNRKDRYSENGYVYNPFTVNLFFEDGFYHEY